MSEEIIVEAISVTESPVPSDGAVTNPQTPQAKAVEETVWQCYDCQSVFSKHKPRCSACYSFNTLCEVKRSSVRLRPVPIIPVGVSVETEEISGYQTSPLMISSVQSTALVQGKAVRLADLDDSEFGEISTGESSVDYVLGGGMFSPSVILIGGDPGVGKSRLLTRIFAKVGEQYPCLYGGGEESQKSIAVRAKRLGAVNDRNKENLHIIQGTDLDEFLVEAKRLGVKLAILDSLQTFHDKEFPDHKPGSIRQLTSISEKFHKFCHANDIIGWLVCHVTKGGDFHGPNTVDHAVDANIMLTKLDNGQVGCTSTKNRNGSTEVAGLLEHRIDGLRSVD